VKVSDLRLDVDKGRSCLSASLGGERVHLTSHDAPQIVNAGDAFVLLALIPSMERGEALEVEESIPVSASLLRRLRTVQEIYVQWFPHLQTITVNAPNTEVPAPVTGGRVGCFFSGGVDSVYSVMRNLSEIDDLVICRGLDIPFAELERWDRTVHAVRSFAASIGKNVQIVETDAKSRFQSSRSDNHGAVLASCGIPLGYRRLIIPASHTYLDDLPHGSHPLLDPLWSTDLTEVEHDGAHSRTLKTREIAKSKEALEYLRVCNRQATYNCSECEKCLRTMTVLKLIGARTPSLRELAPGSLRGLRLENLNQLLFWVENRELAHELGDVELERVISAIITQYRRRERLRSIDRRYFGELGVRTLRALRRT
jgi:hypothetical protein